MVEIVKLGMVFLLIAVVPLLAACSQGISEDGPAENEITGQAVAKIYKACKLQDGAFCDSECCEVREKCGSQDSGYRECNLETGEWKTYLHSDSRCTEICQNESVPEPNEDKCLEEWVCKDYYHRSFQLTNCSLFFEEYCEKGCANKTCITLCKPGTFICGDKMIRVCDSSGSIWLNHEICEFGCKDSKCLNSTNAQANAAEEQQESTANSTNTAQENNFISDNCISVLNFNYAPAGNNLSQEYFTLKNSCSYTIDMSGWTAKDDAEHIYTFPSFNLGNLAQVTVVTGSGTNNSTTLYWGRGSAVWNNGGDILYLDTSNGTSVLIYSYP